MFPHFRFGLYIRGRNITEMTPCFPLCVLQGGTVLVCPVTGDVNFELWLRQCLTNFPTVNLLFAFPIFRLISGPS